MAKFAIKITLEDGTVVDDVAATFPDQAVLPMQAAATKLGLIDADGNLVVMQVGKNGELIRSKVPEGVRPDLGVKPEEAAAGTARGKARGEASAELPARYKMAAEINQQIESLKTDPYLDRMLGPIDSMLPNVTADAARVSSKIEQLKGGAFLAGRQLLKGGGAITDFESQKAEAAFARLNQAQSPKDFKAALDDFNSAVQEGVRKLEQQAGAAP